MIFIGEIISNWTNMESSDNLFTAKAVSKIVDLVIEDLNRDESVATTEASSVMHTIRTNLAKGLLPSLKDNELELGQSDIYRSMRENRLEFLRAFRSQYFETDDKAKLFRRLSGIKRATVDQVRQVMAGLIGAKDDEESFDLVRILLEYEVFEADDIPESFKLEGNDSGKKDQYIDIWLRVVLGVSWRLAVSSSNEHYEGEAEVFQNKLPPSQQQGVAESITSAPVAATLSVPEITSATSRIAARLLAATVKPSKGVNPVDACKLQIDEKFKSFLQTEGGRKYRDDDVHYHRRLQSCIEDAIELLGDLINENNDLEPFLLQAIRELHEKVEGSRQQLQPAPSGEDRAANLLATLKLTPTKATSTPAAAREPAAKQEAHPLGRGKGMEAPLKKKLFEDLKGEIHEEDEHDDEVGSDGDSSNVSILGSKSSSSGSMRRSLAGSVATSVGSKEIKRLKRFTALKADYNPEGGRFLSMENLAAQLTGTSGREPNGLIMYDIRGAEWLVRLSKTKNMSARPFNTLLSGPPEARDAMTLGSLYDAPNIFPRAHEHFPLFFQREISTLLEWEPTSQEEVKIKNEKLGILNKLSARMNRRITTVMGAHSETHITRFAVLMHFFVVLWNTAMVADTPSLLLDRFDTLWETGGFKARVESVDAVKEVSFPIAAKFLLYSCTYLKCGSAGMFPDFCSHCSPPRLPVTPGHPKVDEKKYQTWKAAQGSGADTSKATYTKTLPKVDTVAKITSEQALWDHLSTRQQLIKAPVVMPTF